MDPFSVPLPAFLDPLLEYLDQNLPPPLYSFVLAFLSHLLALLTAAFNLIYALISAKPWNWDAQTVLPPLISLLAAYLALLSLYRTTTWVLRTFVKWGIIAALLVGGASWVLGRGVFQDGVGGLTAIASDVVLDLFNGQGANAAGGRRSRRVRTGGSPGPKPWESFEQHKEWQYNEYKDGESRNMGAQQVFEEVLGRAGEAMMENGWWQNRRDSSEEQGSSDGSEGPSNDERK